MQEGPQRSLQHSQSDCEQPRLLHERGQTFRAGHVQHGAEQTFFPANVDVYVTPSTPDARRKVLVPALRGVSGGGGTGRQQHGQHGTQHTDSPRSRRTSPLEPARFSKR